MSHVQTVIEPAAGLTVLVGPNNCGKSAVVAALQILAHNENSTYVMRHNAKECSVKVETDDGHVVEWGRKNSPRYLIDGKLFDRLGRTEIPDELHEALRLPKVTAEGNLEFDVHFGEQKSPVFLLDKPGSHAAQFFASSSDAASLVEMQKRHQQKLADARKERSQLETKFAKLSADLVILKEVDQISESVLDVERQHEEIKGESSLIAQLASDLSTLHETKRNLESYESQSVSLAPLNTPPTLIDTESLNSLTQSIAQTQREFDRHSDRANFLSMLQSAPDVSEERALAELYEQFVKAELLYKRAKDQSEASQSLMRPPEMVQTDELQRLMFQMRLEQKNIDANEQHIKSLTTLQPVPQFIDEALFSADLESLVVAAIEMERTEVALGLLDKLGAVPPLLEHADLQRLIEQIDKERSEFNLYEEQSSNLARTLNEAAAALREFAEKENICPTCGATLDPEKLIERAGAGGHTHD